VAALIGKSRNLQVAADTLAAGGLPPPPFFPASNASYVKRAARLQDIALTSTPDTLTAAVTEITGINSYAKILRRYGALLQAWKQQQNAVQV
jgi:hypothetical protein